MIVCRLAAPRCNYLVHSLKRRRSVFQVQVVTLRKVFVFISCFCSTCFPPLGPYGHFDRDIGRRDRIRPPEQHNTTQRASDESRERSCTKGEEPGLPPRWSTLFDGTRRCRPSGRPPLVSGGRGGVAVN